MTEGNPSLSAQQGRSAVLALALLRGAVAAGLGLASVVVLVMVLWISSPAPDNNPGGALHAAAGLWLLAHGAELIRTDTLSGVPAPVGLVPLLLAVVPVWLAHRAARDVLVPEEGRPVLSAVGAFVMVVSGYLLVGVVVAYCVRDGSPAVRPLSLLFPSAVVVAGAAAAGVWTAAGRPVGPPPSWAPVRLHEALAHRRFRERAGTVWRSAAAGVAVLLGGGALLVAVALVWHAHSAQQSFVQLSGDWAGRVAVLLLALVLVPNAAVWGAAYGLGPGFALGTASTVTPVAFAGRPALPRFPLLAAVPAEGPGTVLNWSAVAVPVAAGVTVAWFTVRRAVPPNAAREEAWSLRETALAAVLAAVGCGAGTAVLAAAAGGPLGTRALAEFGPVWWLTGAAALVWTALIGVPAALLLRAWRLREPDGGVWWRRADAVPAEGERAGAAYVAGVPRAVSGNGVKPEPEPERAPGGGPAPLPVAFQPTGAASAPASASVPPAARIRAPDEGEDFAPYDFLPTGPWNERTARPEEAGPSGTGEGA
ncbi:MULTISPECIES: DUF6350 family protein [unclassified Streptomyces]|uniref:cell division protein PerM n=1 Tax=unclassified Streptomyces TaxID=2593676 RepID=UPI0037F26147